MTILFVDDDRTMVEPLREELEDAGHKVIKVDSPTQANNVLDKGARFDLAILDVKMFPRLGENSDTGVDPIIAGIVYYEELRKRFPTLAIILLTNNYEQVPVRLRKGDRVVAWDKVKVAGALADYVSRWMR